MSPSAFTSLTSGNSDGVCACPGFTGSGVVYPYTVLGSLTPLWSDGGERRLFAALLLLCRERFTLCAAMRERDLMRMRELFVLFRGLYLLKLFERACS